MCLIFLYLAFVLLIWRLCDIVIGSFLFYQVTQKIFFKKMLLLFQTFKKPKNLLFLDAHSLFISHSSLKKTSLNNISKKSIYRHNLRSLHTSVFFPAHFTKLFFPYRRFYLMCVKK